MLGSITATAKTLGEARKLQGRVRLATTSYTVAWHAIAALLAAGVADMLLPWPMGLRGLFMAAWIVGTIWAGAHAVRRLRRETPREEQVAREIETRLPELDNALIHAVQFAPAIQLEPNHPSTRLMQREIERAEREAARLLLPQVVERTPLRRGRHSLLCAVLFVAITALLFPRAYRFELPRFFAFWGDWPPFTLTDFRLEPEELHLRSGESVTVRVHVGGLLPRRIALITGDRDDPGQATPLLVTGEDSYTASLEHLTHDTWFIASADTGRSKRHWIFIANNPLCRKMVVTTHPPAYARRPDSSAEIANGGEISGLAHTQVEVDVESDRPLARGELTLQRAAMPALTVALAPKPGQPTHVIGTFAIERDGYFHLSLQSPSSAGGLRTPEAAQGKIVLQRDEAPIVSILAPGQNVIAKPDTTIPLKVEAEDDIALQRLELHRTVNKGKESAQVIPVPDGQRTLDYTDRFDLKAMGAKPGDVIEYYATAYDNDPKGIHNTDSDRYWIWVVSKEDYERVMAQQRGPEQMIAQYRAQVDTLQQVAAEQAQLAKEMAANAEQAQKTPANDARAQARLKQQTEALRQRQRDLQKRTQEAAHQMHALAGQKPQFDIEKGLQRKLEQMAREMEQAGQAMQQAGAAQQPGQMPVPAHQAASRLQQAMQNAGQNIEKTLRTLERSLPLYSDLQQLQQLAKEQAQLAQQAKQVAESLQGRPPDPFAQSRLKSLAQQQARTRDALSQVQENLRAHAQDCQSVAPDAARTGTQIADAIDKQNIGPTMQGAQQSLESKDASNGAQQAEAAQKALESLLGACKQGQQQAQGMCNSAAIGQLGMSAGSSLGQMASRMGMGRMGMGQGDGQGSGSGKGDYDAPQPGSRPGDQSGNQMQNFTQRAMAIELTRQQLSGTRPRKDKNGGPRGANPADLSNNTEPSPAAGQRPLPKGTDRDASRYPSEYRRLVQDYFKAVAGGK